MRVVAVKLPGDLYVFSFFISAVTKVTNATRFVLVFKEGNLSDLFFSLFTRGGGVSTMTCSCNSASGSMASIRPEWILLLQQG